MKSDKYADEKLNTEDAYISDETQSEIQTDVDAYAAEEEQSSPDHKIQETPSHEQPVQETAKGRLGRRTRKDKAHKDDAASIEHDLTRLKKKDLLEIMLAQGKEIDSLRERVADLEAQLANREFEFEKIGSIAEASLAVTNIFKEAEEAARIYIDNIRRGYEKRSKQHSDD